ncbi:MAG TPA: GGDEF domain-containing protein [Gaiellaceae bacterium]|nr:GGDEF domain-containing protein [Gaiellaceae bacterium]
MDPTLGLRLRLMLTLGAVAVLPLAGVAYVVAHDEVANVDSSLAFQRHDAELAAQAKATARLSRRELSVVTAAAATRLRRNELRTFARRHHVVLEVGGHRYGRLLPHALAARLRLVSGGHRIGTAIVQVAAPRAHLPAGIGARRTAAVYRRVEEGSLLALAALMLLAFFLAQPLLRALRWTEQRAGESRVDSLTAIPNRRALEETLAAEISRAERFGHELAVVLLDLDHFKRINDTHGHAAGDRLLREVAGLLHASARQGDTVARWGGEEFVAVLPETNLAGAVQLAERLRTEIGRISLGAIRASASCGVATLVAGDGTETLLAAADAALYRAKENGRDRTEVATRNGIDDFPLPRAS